MASNPISEADMYERTARCPARQPNGVFESCRTPLVSCTANRRHHLWRTHSHLEASGRAWRRTLGRGRSGKARGRYSSPIRALPDECRKRSRSSHAVATLGLALGFHWRVVPGRVRATRNGGARRR